MAELTAIRVHELFTDCLGAEENSTEVFGLVRRAWFDPARLAEHKPEIAALLAELPEQFRSERDGGGGGWSFLNACMDRETVWGEQADVESLVMLGIGVGLVEYCLPREMWPILPGGVPYFMIRSVSEALDGPRP